MVGRQHGVVSRDQLLSIGVLSHRAAGDLHDLRNSRRLEVTLPRGRAVPPEITVRHSRILDPRDFTEVDGIPVTTVARTLLDLAAVLSVRDPGYALDRAERLQVLEIPQVNVVLRGERYEHVVDAYWPAHDLVVQLDGFAYHRTRRDRERTRTATATWSSAAIACCASPGMTSPSTARAPYDESESCWEDEPSAARGCVPLARHDLGV